jgi:hypothetical protein
MLVAFIVTHPTQIIAFSPLFVGKLLAFSCNHMYVCRFELMRKEKVEHSK